MPTLAPPIYALAEPAAPKILSSLREPYHFRIMNNYLGTFEVGSTEVLRRYMRGCIGVLDNMYGVVTSITTAGVSRCRVCCLPARWHRQTVMVDLPIYELRRCAPMT